MSAAYASCGACLGIVTEHLSDCRVSLAARVRELEAALRECLTLADERTYEAYDAYANLSSIGDVARRALGKGDQ